MSQVHYHMGYEDATEKIAAWFDRRARDDLATAERLAADGNFVQSSICEASARGNRDLANQIRCGEWKAWTPMSCGYQPEPG
jgi:hypothetical protein